MESSNKTTSYHIRYIPVEIDQQIESFIADEYQRTGTKRTKQEILIDALEYGLKQRGIVE